MADAAAAPKSVTIPRRFNGPVESGNGGYAAGVFAGLIDGPAEVSLRSPVLLDVPLAVSSGEDGIVRLMDGETLVAEVRPAAPPELRVPAAVSLTEARQASRGYAGKAEGPFSRCFVCGLAREDSFEVFAGPAEGGDVVASTWTPPEWSGDQSGNVRPEFIWATLDCPTYFALYDDPATMSFLVRMSARIDAPVRVGVEHVVVAWPLGRDGRKHEAASAILSAGGETLALATGLLIATSA